MSNTKCTKVNYLQVKSWWQPVINSKVTMGEDPTMYYKNPANQPNDQPNANSAVA